MSQGGINCNFTPLIMIFDKTTIPSKRVTIKEDDKNITDRT